MKIIKDFPSGNFYLNAQFIRLPKQISVVHSAIYVLPAYFMPNNCFMYDMDKDM